MKTIQSRISFIASKHFHKEKSLFMKIVMLCSVDTESEERSILVIFIISHIIKSENIRMKKKKRNKKEIRNEPCEIIYSRQVNR